MSWSGVLCRGNQSARRLFLTALSVSAAGGFKKAGPHATTSVYISQVCCKVLCHLYDYPGLYVVDHLFFLYLKSTGALRSQLDAGHVLTPSQVRPGPG